MLTVYDNANSTQSQSNEISFILRCVINIRWNGAVCICDHCPFDNILTIFPKWQTIYLICFENMLFVSCRSLRFVVKRHVRSQSSREMEGAPWPIECEVFLLLIYNTFVFATRFISLLRLSWILNVTFIFIFIRWESAWMFDSFRILFGIIFDIISIVMIFWEYVRSVSIRKLWEALKVWR